MLNLLRAMFARGMIAERTVLIELNKIL
jgi:hypothetical protein